MRAKPKVEFGDFQTPDELAAKVCERLMRLGFAPNTVIEPTCGTGSFVAAALTAFPSLKRVLAVDINLRYVKDTITRIHGINSAAQIQIETGNFFEIDWSSIYERALHPVLFLGNPPWATNAALGSLGSSNVPIKSNFQNHSGLDAITGKANFDISEWMLIRLTEILASGGGGLAMLCKSAVARKLLIHAAKVNSPLRNFHLFPIDAFRYFGVAVEACLFVYKPTSHKRKTYDCRIYKSLDSIRHSSIIGYREGSIVSDTSAYHNLRHLMTHQQKIWRSGIKHDCASVMELLQESGQFRNRLGEYVEIEDQYLYPMLKSADLANGTIDHPRRWMIVPQNEVFEDTAIIKQFAPKTWDYLSSHRQYFMKRASSIYKDKPPFSVFGVGAYSFAPWKIAIAGLYKSIRFRLLGPYNDKPWILDDTCYFLPFNSQELAENIYTILIHPKVTAFYQSLIFPGNKRPVTKEILDKLNIEEAAKIIGLPLKWHKSEAPIKVNKNNTLPLLFGNAKDNG